MTILVCDAPPCPRPAFLADLAPLLPCALALAGDEKQQVADGIARAIQELPQQRDRTWRR